eukprot:4979819-Alexandrium_andersonii.AAC.1
MKVHGNHEMLDPSQQAPVSCGGPARGLVGPVCSSGSSRPCVRVPIALGDCVPGAHEQWKSNEDAGQDHWLQRP